MLWRVVRSRLRLFIGFLVGIGAWLFLPGGLLATTRGIVAWDVGVLVYLLLSAQLFLTATPAHMPANAEAQEEGEWTIFAITLAIVVISFIAVGTEFAAIKRTEPDARGIAVALVAGTLFISWLMSHVTFAYRYAHEFYERQEDGTLDHGLEFPGEPQPDYLDFMYFALVLGMTFQVSDVQITSRKLRRVAALHGLLSFLFNTVILALTVNIAAGLMG
ncbi:MAG TPA: DUF1345 domain-containing protein [Rhodopila sp.]|nr:DUF1345 domain-containing protein [Rhodopila sp.]